MTVVGPGKKKGQAHVPTLVRMYGTTHPITPIPLSGPLLGKGSGSGSPDVYKETAVALPSSSVLSAQYLYSTFVLRALRLALVRRKTIVSN